VISGIKRISRPGARLYVGSHDVKPVVGGLGISIVTTPKGLMSGRAARKAMLAANCSAKFGNKSFLQVSQHAAQDFTKG
jgi:Ribosomal protein S8